MKRSKKSSKRKLPKRELTEGEKKLLRRAKKKNILPSVIACNNLAGGKGWKIELQFENSSTKLTETRRFPIYLKHTPENSLQFEIRSPKYINVRGPFYKDNYGLNATLKLINSRGEERYTLDHSVTNFIPTFPNGKHILNGSFNSLSTTIKNNSPVYYRLMIKIVGSLHDLIYPFQIVQTKNFLKFDQEELNAQMSAMGIRFVSMKGTYVEISIEDTKYDFYIVEDVSTQFIDSQTKIDLDTFKKHTLAIRSAFAVLSGKFYRDQTFYLSSRNKDFSSIRSTTFELEEKTIITDNRLVDPVLTREYLKGNGQLQTAIDQKHHIEVATTVFSQLSSSIVKNPEVKRTIDLLVHANNNLSPLQRGIIHSVALETLSGFVYDSKKSTLKPVKDKEIARNIRKDLEDTLGKYKEQISDEAIKIFTSKIEQLNQPTNRQKLTIPFEVSNVTLTDYERKLLELRNKFLHGESPLDDLFELQATTLHLHHLIGCLLLKLSGHSGYIMNLASLHFFRYFESVGAGELEQLKPKVKPQSEIDQLMNDGKYEIALKAMDDTIKFLQLFANAQQKLSEFVRLI